MGPSDLAYDMASALASLTVMAAAAQVCRNPAPPETGAVSQRGAEEVARGPEGSSND